MVVAVVVGDEIFSEDVPLAPSLVFFFLSTSLVDSFVYWGPCGSRNSFAVILPLHTKRSTASGDKEGGGGGGGYGKKMEGAGSA